MQEAILYEKLADQKVKCLACNHYCQIQVGKRGICGIRENFEGKLYLLTYGHAIAAHIDPIEKKPLFHFLPGTDIYSIATMGCNFRCLFCQNDDISQSPKCGRLILGEALPPEQIVENALKMGCKSIAYTYTEPTTFFEYAYDTAKLAVKYGLKNVFVSNGYMSREAIQKIKPYLHAVNVDIKAFTEKFYQEICGAKLEHVLATVKLLHQEKIWVEITTLVIPGYNDSDQALKGIAEFIYKVDPGMPWHLSRFYPAYKMLDVSPTSVEILEKGYEIGKKAGLKYVYVGNVPGHDYESTMCAKCGTLLIDRFGYQTKLRYKKGGKCYQCGEQLTGVY